MHLGMQTQFTYRGHEQDRLFAAAYDHFGSNNACDTCEASGLVTRSARDRHDPVIHYGLIASGNQVIKHGGTRDKLGHLWHRACIQSDEE